MNIKNDKLEKDVLAYLFFNPKKCIDLTKEHFLEYENKSLFETINKLFLENKKINLYTILEINKEISSDYIEEIINLNTQYESILALIDFNKRRELFIKASYFINNITKQENLEEFASRFMEGINKTIKNKKEKTKTTEDFVNELLEDIAKNDKGEFVKYWTGYKNIDDKMNGLEPGNIHIIAGRPSVGKTTFAMSYVCNLALAGEKIFVKSLETKAKKLVKKMIENISATPLKTFNCDSDTMQKIEYGVRKMLEVKNNVFFCEEYNSDIDYIIYQIREQKIKNNISIVLIDHMQLVTSNAYKEKRLQVGDISRKLKKISNELDLHIIILSQLSRSVEQRVDKRPMLSDLRESGDIEQDADLIALLYRDDYYNSSQQSVAPLLEINYQKNRDGETFKSYFIFQKNIAKFLVAEGIDGF